MSKDKNIVKFHRSFHVNIGFVVFSIIIIYVIFNIYSYLTSNVIAEYEVTQGTIATNTIYKGLILRDETVYYAEQAGYIDYYVKNGSKIGLNSVICSIDTTGEISDQISSAGKKSSDLNPDVCKHVLSELSAYTDSYDPMHFSTVYNFKNDINSELSQNLSTNVLSSMGELVEKALQANTFYQLKPKNPGIVVYSVDGMESKRVENFTREDFYFDNYSKTNLDTADKVNVADPVFKMINGEKWNIILPVPEDIIKKLENKKTVKVRICLDGYETYASFDVLKKNGNYYLNLSFSNSMIRYLSERYLDVELVLDVEEGLKIPNSAITQKRFFTIPDKFFTKGDNSSSLGVLVQRITDGKKEEVFETPTIYAKKDGLCYVDSEKVRKGDVLVKAATNEIYEVGSDTAELKGVFNINKGYAVFKQIEILYQNEEYTIIALKTNYGIDLYDHIALDSRKIKENELIVN